MQFSCRYDHGHCHQTYRSFRWISGWFSRSCCGHRSEKLGDVLTARNPFSSRDWDNRWNSSWRFPIASLGIPSFVASLAGWLIYRGILLLVTSDTGTIIIDEPFFIAISNGFIPDIFPMQNFFQACTSSLSLLGHTAILWSIMSNTKVRNNKGLQLRGCTS